MSDEKTIENRAITVKDSSGKIHRFKARVCSSYSQLNQSDALTFYVSYDKMPILGMTVYKVQGKDEFRTDCTSGWTFELFESMRGKGIGTRLWKEIETLFYKYDVTCVWGQVETMGKNDDEIKRTADFWESVGFKIVRKYEICKKYKSTAT